MRLIALVLVVVVGLPTPAALSRSTGDEAGTLKGARGVPKAAPSGAPKAKPKAPSLMEDEGIFYKNKPAGTPKPR